MLGNVASGKALERNDLLGAREVRQRGWCDVRHESKAGAMLGAVAAVVVVAVSLLDAMTVIDMRLHRAAVVAGGANAASHGRDAAQWNQREHSADEQQLESAFHGAGC